MGFVFGQNVPNNAEDTSPIKVGEKLPNAKVTNITGDEISLNSLVADKPAILVFYRGDWCPYCMRHLAQIEEIKDQLTGMGYNLFAICPDKVSELQKTVDKKELSYTFLSDSKMDAAQKLGIAFKLDEPTVTKYKGYNIDLERSSDQNHGMLPVPAVFLVSKSGEILFSYTNPDYKKRLSQTEILSAAKEALSKR
jgi:peroxiredoxin